MINGCETMSEERRQYTMYPQKTYGGYVETQVLEDGCIKYYIHLMGSDRPNVMIVDPADENQLRGVRQLHLIMNKPSNDHPDAPNYVIEGDNIEEVLSSIQHMFRKVDA